MESTESINSSWSDFYRNGTIIILGGFIAALLLMITGWNGWLNYFNDQPQIWFQRAGSMMTVILLVSDYYVFQLSSDLSEINMMPRHAIETKDRYRPHVKWMSVVAVVFTILATFIWGYGDLVYCQFKCI